MLILRRAICGASSRLATTRVVAAVNTSISSTFRGSGASCIISRPFSLEVEYKEEMDSIKDSYLENHKRRQSKIGEVVSTKMMKTVNVMVKHMKFFPKYNKYQQRRRKIMAHDENEVGKLGDMVRIATHRPMSKMKRHYLIDIIKKAPQTLADGSIDEASLAGANETQYDVNVPVEVYRKPKTRKTKGKRAWTKGLPKDLPGYGEDDGDDDDGDGEEEEEGEARVSQ
jgi:small subunit ribosomal protein S17